MATRAAVTPPASVSMIPSLGRGRGQWQRLLISGAALGWAGARQPVTGPGQSVSILAPLAFTTYHPAPHAVDPCPWAAPAPLAPAK